MEQYKEINGIGYTLVGDYYLPNLLPHQEPARPVGVWGRRRMEYLKRHRRGMFSHLLTCGGLNAHLADTDERAGRCIPAWWSRWQPAKASRRN